ncbi:SOS response-associated peptidase family protein [Prosthecobacter algae]
MRYWILTNTPNDQVAQVYNRMSAILPAESWQGWLDGRTPTAVTY